MSSTDAAPAQEVPWRRGWESKKNCIGADPDIFFSSNAAGLKLARVFCDNCEVRNDCLEYALANHIDHGVWGGESERGRKRIRKARARDRQAASDAKSAT